MPSRFYDKNLGLSSQDPNYDDEFNSEEEYGRYLDACDDYADFLREEEFADRFEK